MSREPTTLTLNDAMSKRRLIGVVIALVFFDVGVADPGKLLSYPNQIILVEAKFYLIKTVYLKMLI